MLLVDGQHVAPFIVSDNLLLIASISVETHKILQLSFHHRESVVNGSHPWGNRIGIQFALFQERARTHLGPIRLTEESFEFTAVHIAHLPHCGLYPLAFCKKSVGGRREHAARPAL